MQSTHNTVATFQPISVGSDVTLANPNDVFFDVTGKCDMPIGVVVISKESAVQFEAAGLGKIIDSETAKARLLKERIDLVDEKKDLSEIKSITDEQQAKLDEMRAQFEKENAAKASSGSNNVEDKPLSVTELIAGINLAENEEALDKLVPAGEKRKEVVDAFDARKKALKEANKKK